MHFSEKDYPSDVLARIHASMRVPPEYEKLGWKLSTSRKTDNAMRLLGVHDLQTVFEAVREAQEEQARGKGKAKNIIVEIKNLVST